MVPELASPLPLLVVEADAELQAILVDLLQEEGYQVQGVASLDEALRCVEEQVFALILAHLFAGRSPYALTPAHMLRRRAQPTPVGLLLSLPLPADAGPPAGIAFVLPIPFELNDLIRLVAMTLQSSWSSEQQRQAEVVKQYLTAVHAAEWETVAQLCAAEVAFYPPAGSAATSARKLVGLVALRQYAERTHHHARLLEITDLRLYARPHGVVAHYLSHVVTPDGTLQRLVTTTTFHFVGERIGQVGIRVPLVRRSDQHQTAS